MKLLLILAMSFLIASCGSVNREEESASPSAAELAAQQELEEAPEEMLSSFSVSGYSKGGKKQWDLEGKSANIMDAEISLTEVTGKVYGKDTNMTIVADEGSLNKVDNNVHLEKNVKATTDDGATLVTDYLDWDAQQEKLSSEAPVWLARGKMKASGKGIVGQPTLGVVELKKDVVVELNLPEEDAQTQEGPSQLEQAESTAEPLTKDEAVTRELEGVKGIRETTTEVFAPATVITCNGPLEVDYQSNIAIFRNNVKVNDERGEIFADQMDVYFATDSEDGKKVEGIEGMGIDKIICIGNVEIHHGENITYSEKAIYDTETGMLTLTGSPKLVIFSTEGFSSLMGGSESEQEESAEEEKLEVEEEEDTDAFIEDEWTY